MLRHRRANATTSRSATTCQPISRSVPASDGKVYGARLRPGAWPSPNGFTIGSRPLQFLRFNELTAPSSRKGSQQRIRSSGHADVTKPGGYDFSRSCPSRSGAPHEGSRSIAARRRSPDDDLFTQRRRAPSRVRRSRCADQGRRGLREACRHHHARPMRRPRDGYDGHARHVEDGDDGAWPGERGRAGAFPLAGRRVDALVRSAALRRKITSG